MRNKSLSQGSSPVVIALIIGVSLLLGGGFLVVQNFTPAPPSPIKEVEQVNYFPSQLTPGDKKSTFADIIGSGESLECNWKIPAETETPFNAGKLWTTGKQGRSSITADINGFPMEANAIYRDNTVYSWMSTNGITMGIKFAPDELDNTSMTTQQRQQAEQIKREMIFNCKSWTPDALKFVLPTDVEFKNL